MAGQGLDGDFLEADAFNLGGRALEAFLDEFGGNADGFEDLRATVAVDHRDAHLGHDLEDAGFDGFAVVDGRLGEIAVGAVALEKFANGLEGEVGIDCRSAEANEAGDLVHIAGFAGLANQAGAHAFPNANQVVVHRSHGEQHRNGNPPVVDSRVRENEDACASIDRRLGIGADAIDGWLEAFFAFGGVPECRNCGGHVFVADGLNRRELLVEKHRRLETDEAGMLGRFGEHVFAPAEHGIEAHHELLADRIDRRVGNLCDELLEVGVEQAWFCGEDRERGVISHRAHGFGTVFEHGFDDHVHFLGRISEGDLTLGKCEDVEFAGGCCDLFFCQLRQVAKVVFQPFAIRLAGGEASLDVGIAEELSGCRVDGDHFAGGKTAFFNTLELVELGAADLGGHDEHTVLGDVVACRPESVAVEAGSSDDAIGEGEGCWSIPRLGEAPVVVVEILEFL